MIEANRLVAKIQDFSLTRITYHSIPISHGEFLLATDASWANANDLRSQAGYMIMFCNKEIRSGKKGESVTNALEDIQA